MTLLARALRLIAIVIAVLGVVDPAFTWPRTDRPLVALIDAGGRGASAATDRVARALAANYEVHRGPIAGAESTVLVGTVLPGAPPAVSGAVVAVAPTAAARRVEIIAATAPAVASPAARIPVVVTLRAVGVNGRTLRVDVLDGRVLLDRRTIAVPNDDARLEVTLSAAALQIGLTRLAIRVSDDAADGAAPTAAASAPAASDIASLGGEAVTVTEVADERWPVLVVDARPSWMSTFVRRAIEADRRFVVTSRVNTSTTVAVESGNAPALSNADALTPFAAIVIGAPDALAASDVRALETFARRRGGAVVLLMDRPDTGPFAALTSAAAWRDVRGVERRVLATPAGSLVATELAVPTSLAAGVDVLAAAGNAETPAVWQAPLGAGRVIVNGALDAWRYRVREQNGFARFWTHTIGRAAASAPPAISVEPATRVLAPNASLDVRVTVRAVQLSDPTKPAPTVAVRARAIARGAIGDGELVHLWPTPERGVFAGSLTVGATQGTHRIVADVVSADGAALGSASADVLTGEELGAPASQDLAAWATAQGGVSVTEADAPALERALRAHAAPPTAEQVRPMRSMWWLPVFIAALGGEWWLRRRRGER
ncbi:MAG: hypothetical protein K8S21_09465 [Gemmatimonadetes bacterium]|nr:hypothetical protein [Gemmatimonadota bacterium]